MYSTAHDKTYCYSLVTYLATGVILGTMFAKTREVASVAKIKICSSLPPS